MSKRKGLSAEEKRNRMLDLFYEKKEFFQLKELEKIAPKEKGIISQSVKDVVKSLVDDGLVDSEKIGTSVYFWAFPSKAIHLKKQKLVELTSQVEELDKRLKVSREKVITAKVGREDTPRRAQVLQKLKDLKEEEESISLEIEKYKAADPDTLAALKTEAQAAKDAANRWTDNIFAVKSWCKNNFFIEGEVLDQQFGIPSELDYID